MNPALSPASSRAIPYRAQTLDVLRLMGNFRPLLMLPGDDDGYGARWLLDGGQVLPAIAKYLIDGGFVVQTATTAFGARELTLTAAGRRLRDNGLRWWRELSLWQRLGVIVFG